jgi:hypothetical protein
LRRAGIAVVRGELVLRFENPFRRYATKEANQKAHAQMNAGTISPAKFGAVVASRPQ